MDRPLQWTLSTAIAIYSQTRWARVGKEGEEETMNDEDLVHKA